MKQSETSEIHYRMYRVRLRQILWGACGAPVARRGQSPAAQRQAMFFPVTDRRPSVAPERAGGYGDEQGGDQQPA